MFGRNSNRDPNCYWVSSSYINNGFDDSDNDLNNNVYDLTDLGVIIKYARSDFAILDPFLPSCKCTYAFSLHPSPLVRASG